MSRLRRRETENEKSTWLTRNAEIQNSTGETESLYWAALIITGNPDAAEQSLVDAGVLADTEKYAFRDWLVRWGRSPNARAGVNTVRAFIHETAAQYADQKCSHAVHPPLSQADIESLRQLDAHEVIEQLDILARTTLVLYGCRHASLSECALVLNVPLDTVAVAYCRALEWYRDFARNADKLGHVHASALSLVRHDSDGVPVWDSNLPVQSNQ
jgi:hypothetical protein